MKTYLILSIIFFFSINSLQGQDNYAGKFSDIEFYRLGKIPVPLNEHVGFDHSEGITILIDYGKSGAFKTFTAMQGSDTICFSSLNFPEKEIKWTKIENGIWINSVETQEDFHHSFNKNDEIKMHYAGFLEDGQPFDNSFIRNKPLQGKLSRFIKGFSIGAINVKPNSIRIIKISPEKAYGSKGGGNIPPNSTIYYVIYNLQNPKVA